MLTPYAPMETLRVLNRVEQDLDEIFAAVDAVTADAVSPKGEEESHV
jgi:hypothetical protein